MNERCTQVAAVFDQSAMFSTVTFTLIVPGCRKVQPQEHRLLGGTDHDPGTKIGSRFLRLKCRWSSRVPLKRFLESFLRSKRVISSQQHFCGLYSFSAPAYVHLTKPKHPKSSNHNRSWKTPGDHHEKYCVLTEHTRYRQK